LYFDLGSLKILFAFGGNRYNVKLSPALSRTNQIEQLRKHYHTSQKDSLWRGMAEGVKERYFACEHLKRQLINDYSIIVVWVHYLP